MKKIIMVNGIIITSIIVIGGLLLWFTRVSLTDYLFVCGMMMLTASAACLTLARKEMRRSVHHKSVKDKNEYKRKFHVNEKYAFTFFFLSVILMGMSYFIVMS